MFFPCVMCVTIIGSYVVYVMRCWHCFSDLENFEKNFGIPLAPQVHTLQYQSFVAQSIQKLLDHFGVILLNTSVTPTVIATIEYGKAEVFLKKNSLEPCLNFTNIHALQKHVIKALSQLFWPQNAIHCWLGLAMDPATYLLLEGVAFVPPNDPGPTLVYPQ